MTDLQAELEVLVATAAEAASAQVSEDTRKSFALSVTHLTFTLRHLRAEGQSNAGPQIADILLRTVPCALAVFHSTRATYDLNHETCQKTVVFLGFLYGVPQPDHVSKNTSVGLQNSLQGIPQCFFNFASSGRTGDVRSLLNALFLVAGGTVKHEVQISAVWRLLTLPAQIFRANSVEEDRFVKTLRALLAGWVASSQSLQSWTPVQYLDIAEAVSMALSMRLDGAKSREEALALIARIHTAAQRHEADHPRRTCLVPLAFASGVLKALDGYKLGESVPLLLELFESIKKVAVKYDAALRKFNSRITLKSFAATDCATLSAAFLVFRIAHSLGDSLAVEHIGAFRAAMEVLVSCTAIMETEKVEDVDLFHRQLLWCVSSYASMLGSSYACFTIKECRGEEAARFLQALAAENPSSGTANRFLLAATLDQECTPLVSVRLVDGMSLLKNQTPAIMEGCARRLVPVIAEDTFALRSLLRLVVALEDTGVTRVERSRLLFLIQVVCLCMRERSRDEDQPLRDAGEGKADFGDEDVRLWEVFEFVIRRTLLENVTEEDYAVSCIACLNEMIRSRARAVREARSSLILELPAVLIDKYLFANNPSMQHKHAVNVVSVFDSIAASCASKAMLEESIRNVQQIAEGLDEKQNRLVGVMLLRFMGRCSVEVLDVVIQGVANFIGDERDRKLQFLPVVSMAVLGTDMVRKSTCVAWLMAFFRDVSGTATGYKAERLSMGQAKM